MVDSGWWSSLLVHIDSQDKVVGVKLGQGVDRAWRSPQLSIISDSSCRRSSSPMLGSTSSPSKCSSVNSLIRSSKSSTAEVEGAAVALEVDAVRAVAMLCLRDLGWVGVFRTGLKCAERPVIYLFVTTLHSLKDIRTTSSNFHCTFNKGCLGPLFLKGFYMRYLALINIA